MQALTFKYDNHLLTKANDTIQMNANDIKKHNLRPFSYVHVLNKDPDNSIRCMIEQNDTVAEGYVKITKRIHQLLDLQVGEVYVSPIPFHPVRLALPKVENINKEYVYVSPDLLKTYGSRVELINTENGYRMYLQVKANPNYQPSVIALNRNHRLLLGIQSKHTDAIIVTQYVTAKSSDIETTAHEKLRAFLSNQVFSKLRWVSDSIGEFMIGSRALKLRVGYLYPFDDSQNIARIHANTRKLLGLNETDNIVIQYKNRRVKLPLFDLYEKHLDVVIKMDEDNEFTDSHFYIGVPAEIRNKMGIPDINTVVEVRRCKSYLLKKHINKLILPTLGVYFSLDKLFNGKGLYVLLALLFISPIIIYASLSEERAKVK
ncbi:hypothetical protein ACFDTO_33845 [Microbacteriaceae bacterium 4G12]